VKDFTPIGLGVYAPFLLAIHPSLPVTNLKEFIALGKAQPTRINFASPGVGTPNHLGAELLKSMTGLQFTHVPYKGGGPAIIDLVGGRAQAIFGGVPYVGPHAKAGRLRVIAIGHPVRISTWPDTPAIAETYPGFTNTTWYGLLGPAGFPRPAVIRINSEMKKAAANAEFVKQLDALGLLATSSTPEEFRDMIRAELKRWTTVIKQAGITTDALQ
jgi:tripartite-type tricarboxylate transporter receptor subunit TctC